MFKIGFGYDLHRFEENRPLILGGIKIDHPLGLKGHSDADALLHAITDGLLGALALGDIGKHFPDTDPEFKDADSSKLLGHVVSLIQKNGYGVANCDSTIIADSPKMAPYIDSMRESIAKLLYTEKENVSVKATTQEGLMPDAIAVHSVILLQKR